MRCRTRPVGAPVRRLTAGVEKKDAAARVFCYDDGMLDLDRIAEVTEEVASDIFGRGMVKDVRVEPMSEWTGDDALDVIVVLSKSADPRLEDGENMCAMLLNLGDKLYELGELRFAHVRYRTQEESNAGGDSGPTASA
jgi:hypothetical protein